MRSVVCRVTVPSMSLRRGHSPRTPRAVARPIHFRYGVACAIEQTVAVYKEWFAASGCRGRRSSYLMLSGRCRYRRALQLNSPLLPFGGVECVKIRPDIASFDIGKCGFMLKPVAQDHAARSAGAA